MSLRAELVIFLRIIDEFGMGGRGMTLFRYHSTYSAWWSKRMWRPLWD